VNLFDPKLQVERAVAIAPASRQFLIDLDGARMHKPHLLASACKALVEKQSKKEMTFAVEGIEATPAIMLLESPKPPRSITLNGNPLTSFEYSPDNQLLWIHFENKAACQTVTVNF